MDRQGITIYICGNAFDPDRPVSELRHAAVQEAYDVEVDIQSVPCSGKIDVIYMLRAFEGGLQGLALITCPPGKCRNVEGNYRAMVRISQAALLLEEVGLGSERLLILHTDKDQEGRDLPTLVEQAVRRLVSLPANPVAKPAEPARTEQE